LGASRSPSYDWRARIRASRAQQSGKMSEEEFDIFLRDTVNFLEYISEPIRNARRALGIKVLMFLAFFLILAYLLKKEIWKDVK